MKQSELFKLTCQCLLLDEFPELKEGIREKFISRDVNLDAFVLLCSNHFVLPAVTIRLQNSGLIELLPDDYADHLNEIYLLNRKRNKEILKQIDEISIRLEKAYIKPLYLKGTANLMDNLYPHSGDRMIGDIDFLVKEKDYLKTAELVLELGYINEFATYDDFQEMKHYPRLYRTNVPADVEIHRIPVNISHSKQFNTELLFQNKKAIKNRSNTFVSSNKHKLIHTFIHSQLSNKGYRFKQLGLRDLYDSYLLSKRVDVNIVVTEVEEKKKARLFFEYTKYIFNPESTKTTQSTKAFNKFVVKHQWFLNHARWHYWYINILKLYQLIAIRYFARIVKALFQKSSFKHIYNRLRDRKWYRMHFSQLKKTFFP
jgi:hypothetical protein